MDPGKGKGQEYSRKEPVPFLFTWGPVHLIVCHFPQDGGQLVIEACLHKNKAALVAEMLLLSAHPGLQAPALGSGLEPHCS